MRLYVKVKNQPAIIVGYGPSAGGPVAIVMGLAPHPVATPLEDCIFPKLPRKLEKKIKAWARREMQEAQTQLAEGTAH